LQHEISRNGRRVAKTWAGAKSCGFTFRSKRKETKVTKHIVNQLYSCSANAISRFEFESAASTRVCHIDFRAWTILRLLHTQILKHALVNSRVAEPARIRPPSERLSQRGQFILPQIWRVCSSSLRTSDALVADECCYNLSTACSI
jgi:hypothetical protein